MSDKLDNLWNEAATNAGQPVPVGRIVVCDVCDEDYTDRPDSGGFIFCSSAYCPKCGEAKMPVIQSYHEEHFIKARCPAGQSFADFVRNYRGPDAFIRIT